MYFASVRIMISIHAPREGSDDMDDAKFIERLNFYPRSPRGERLSARPANWSFSSFLSTLPARGAT